MAEACHRVSMGRSEVDPDLRDKRGMTPLPTAGKAGSFDCPEALVWGGADARLKARAGKLAPDFLDRKGLEFVERGLRKVCRRILR